jgi:hypothetical protein
MLVLPLFNREMRNTQLQPPGPILRVVQTTGKSAKKIQPIEKGIKGTVALV